jgi:single-strand DNA-binding protein
MKNLAEFQIIGRVGAIKEVGSTTRVTIASNYPFRDESGEWKNDTCWNEITIFATASQAYVKNHIAKGDLVHARGRIRQASYDRNGERIYTVNLICTDFSRLAHAPDKSGAEPQADQDEASDHLHHLENSAA